jgi:hypothetical protein
VDAAGKLLDVHTGIGRANWHSIFSLPSLTPLGGSSAVDVPSRPTALRTEIVVDDVPDLREAPHVSKLLLGKVRDVASPDKSSVAPRDLLHPNP